MTDHSPLTVAVLGASGFIGSHLIDALLERGHRVLALSRSFPGLIGVSALGHPELEYYVVDLSLPQSLEKALHGVDVCFHLASTTLPSTSNLDPGFDIGSNLLGTINLLEAACNAAVKRVVFSSSGGTVYGIPKQVPISESHPTNPTCSYGITKLAIEKYLALYKQLHGLDSVVLRIANPYGERQRQEAAQGAVAVFLAKALRGEAIEIWGDGTVVRDYLHVSDVVRALLAAADYGGTQPLFNIGSGHGLSLNQLIQAIEKELGGDIQVNYTSGRSCDVPVSILDIQLAAFELGWKPGISFSDGLARMRLSLERF
jgi:UDP-glucose 4-epimerase